MIIDVVFSEIEASIPTDFSGGTRQEIDDAFHKGYTEGQEAGHEAGYTEGHSAGVSEGYADGHTVGYAEGADYVSDAFNDPVIHDVLWDAIQQGGARTAYNNAFKNVAWNDYTFRPKYDITPKGSASGMCHSTRFTNLRECLEHNGVKFDFTNCTSVYQLLYANNVLVEVGDIDVSPVGQCGGMAMGCSSLRKIGLLTVGERNTSYSSMFQNDVSLTEIRIAGVIACDLSFQWSKLLSVESMKSIISCLKNYAGTDKELTYTIKFADECWAALEADSKSPNGGTWEEYVVSLGWNV